jgi:uncharacterized protein YndB with AHSA1/START domain
MVPITSVSKDAESLTMTVVAEFNAPVRRLWDAYLDPRQLERFWCPPSYPTVFTRHDGCVGGRSEFVITAPDGAVSRCYWEWVVVDELKSFEVRDAVAIPDIHSADEQLPAEAPSQGDGIGRMVFAFDTTPKGSRVTTTTYFDSAAHLERMLATGMEHDIAETMGRMDLVLADLLSFAVGNGTTTQLLSDTTVRISRIIRGDLEAVWRAHHEPALLRQWLLGPDGWTMPVCEVATEVGERYRYEWAQIDGDRQFGFTGTLLESLPPHRSVTTETMIGTDGPSSTNELTLTAVEEGALLSIVIAFPDADVRDAVLATGMTDGMETSYARLESLLS